MSQINDALKRAQDFQPKKAPSSVPPMLPAESPYGQHGANWIWPVVVILFLLLFAGLFIAISAGSHAGKKTVAEPAPVPALEAQMAAAPAPKPLPAAPAPDSLAAKAPVPARVQGIVFDPVHPYAIISGKTVHVGEAVDGMRVMAISRDAVTLAANGQTNQLRVGQH
jgi:hypothetical protein